MGFAQCILTEVGRDHERSLDPVLSRYSSCQWLKQMSIAAADWHIRDEPIFSDKLADRLGHQTYPPKSAYCLR